LKLTIEKFKNLWLVIETTGAIQVLSGVAMQRHSQERGRIIGDKTLTEMYLLLNILLYKYVFCKIYNNFKTKEQCYVNILLKIQPYTFKIVF
jgi:hypothetical protein